MPFCFRKSLLLSLFFVAGTAAAFVSTPSRLLRSVVISPASHNTPGDEVPASTTSTTVKHYSDDRQLSPQSCLVATGQMVLDHPHYLTVLQKYQKALMADMQDCMNRGAGCKEDGNRIPHHKEVQTACRQAGGRVVNAAVEVKCRDGWYFDDIHDIACVSPKCSIHDADSFNRQVLNLAAANFEHVHGHCTLDLSVTLDKSRDKRTYVLLMIGFGICVALIAAWWKVTSRQSSPETHKYGNVPTVNDIELS